MSLIVGENSYVDVHQADELIHGRFMTSSKERTYWDSLTNGDKEIILVSTTEKYDKDNLLFKGRKATANQNLQFPRLTNCGNTVEVPVQVVVGYILMGIYDNIIGTSDEAQLQLNGVKSFADGSGARIEFGGTSDLSQQYSKNSLGLYNNVFDIYIKQYTDCV